jgi:acetolactate synthase-1/2/3 large subunit
MTQPTAAQALVRGLVAHGVTHVFCVPGESYLAVLDALADVRETIAVIACRHEAGAANMAVAHGKLTGRPGVCMVTRGPGATHASIGVHTAKQDSVPMILFVGQVARADRGREAFQELDYAAVFGTMAKLALEIDEPDRVPEVLARAFATAVTGRAGPVVVALPEDMLTAPTSADLVPPRPRPQSAPSQAFLAQLADRLSRSERPLMILGGTGWTADSLSSLADWAAAVQLPIALSFRRKDLLDNDHPCYAGDLGLGSNPLLLERVRRADLVIALGARLGENPTQGYTLFTSHETSEKLLHLYPDPAELGRVWPASLSAACDNAVAATLISEMKVEGPDWSDWRVSARAEQDAFSKPIEVGGRVNLSAVFHHLNEVLPDDAIVCNGAGNYAAWLHRFYQHRRLGTQIAPTSGAMGFGAPAAVGAKIVYPEREVVAVSGDGCFLMSGQELATAVQYDARVVFLVVDNGSYGTIRMHQEREYPGRVIATDLKNPDFVLYARSFGAWATRVSATEDFPAALREARSAGRPALIHLVTDVDDIAPGRRLSSS